MDNELLNEMHIIKNHSISTRRLYRTAIKKYTDFCRMSFSELLEEAELEEEQGIRWKKRKIKRRLLTYRQYLLENHTYNSARTFFSYLLATYKYFEIEILAIPPINEKGVTKPEPVTFKDLPDKEIIRNAVKIANPVISAIIYFMVSSGCARRETLNLTIKDYIDALSEYTDKTDIFEMIDELGLDCNVVPTFMILRQKTGKYYTTYCSPEAVNSINSYLLSRNDLLTDNSALFKIDEHYFTLNFVNINNQLGLGKVGTFNRFRSHMLRKFHASALYNDGMSLDKVNDLQGKAKNKTDQSYFMTNPEDLKNEYIEHLSAVTINKEVEKITIKSKEFLMMEQENSELKSELNTIKSDILSIKKKFGA